MLVCGSEDLLSEFKVVSSGAQRTLVGLHHDHLQPWNLGKPHRRRFFVLGLACLRFFRFFFGSRKNAVPRRARSYDVTTEVGNIAGPRQNHVLEGRRRRRPSVDLWTCPIGSLAPAASSGAVVGYIRDPHRTGEALYAPERKSKKCDSAPAWLLQPRLISSRRS